MSNEDQEQPLVFIYRISNTLYHQLVNDRQHFSQLMSFFGRHSRGGSVETRTDSGSSIAQTCGRGSFAENPRTDADQKFQEPYISSLKAIEI
jgi:hypothetical protein